MTLFEKRPVELLVLPMPDEVSLLHPENVMVIAPGSKGAIDIGALCYLMKEPSVKKGLQLHGGRSVDASSLISTRPRLIRSVIQEMSDDLRLGSAARTVFSNVVNFCRFLDWADANGLNDALGEIDNARVAFTTYVEHLRELVRQNAISVNSAAHYQRSVHRILSRLHDTQDLATGVRKVRHSTADQDVTSPPDEAQQGRILSLCSALFSTFTNFVIESRPFPFLFSLPPRGSESSLGVWVFPTANKFHLPWEGELPSSAGQPNIGFNYADGSVRTPDEIRGVAPHRGDFKQASEIALLALREANLDSRHHRRLRLAVTAHNAFVLMFVAHTGMNWAQVEALAWTGKFDVAPERQGFRAIKYRAGGKIVSFQIGAGFLSQFKRFMKLRQYLLDGAPCDSLFFAFGKKLPAPPAKIDSTVVYSFYKLLRRIDPQIKQINLRQWRAAKADWLIRNTDPATTALLLQNSERTVMRHYAAGTETQSAIEFGHFFERVASVVTDGAVPISTTSAVGGCRNFGTPTPDLSPTAIQPDCRQPEGCLFCTQFAVHADEPDVRKLLSCRHCILQTEHLADSEQQFQNLFGPVVQRIDAIVSHISSKSEQHQRLVDLVRSQVEDETGLSPYWERKLQMLVSLGMIA